MAFKALSPEQLEQYDREGFLSPIQVLSDDEVPMFRYGFEELESRCGGKLEKAHLPHLFFKWAYDLVTRPEVVDVIEDILGPDVIIRGTLILCKYPLDPAYVSWHQDGTYSNLELTPTISAWIALSDSMSENGCMRAIPGSHRRGIALHEKTFAEHNLLSYGQSLDVDDAAAVDVELKAGQMSLHCDSLIHSSKPNRSQMKRIGYIVRFITSKFKEALDPVVCVRGRSESSHLAFFNGMPCEDIEESFQAWKEYLLRRNLINQ